MTDSNILAIKKDIDDVYKNVYAKRNSSSEDVKNLISIVERSIRQAKQIDYHDGYVNLLKLQGYLYANLGESEKSLKILEYAEDLCYKYPTNQKIVADLFNILTYYYIEVVNNYHKAAEYGKKALDLATSLDMPHLTAKVTMNIGVIKHDMGLYRESIENFESSLKYALMADDMLLIVYNHVNLGDSFTKLGEIDKALEHYKMAEELNESYQDFMVNIEIKKGLSQIAYMQGDILASCDYLENAIQELNDKEFKTFEAELAILLFERYLEAERLDEASFLMREIEPLIYEVNSSLLIASYHKYRAKIHATEKDYKKAYEHEQQYNTYQEKLNEERQLKNISLIRQESNQAKLEQLRTLSDIGREINTLSSIEDIFDSIYSHLKGFFNEYNLVLGIVNEDYIDYVYVNNKGQKMPIYKVDKYDERYLATWVLKNEEAIVLNDVENELEDYVDETILYGDKDMPQSIAIIPLKFQNDIIGLFGFQTYEKNSISINDAEILSIIASYAAIAVKNSLQANELKDLSTKDQLTGLFNWRYYNSKLVEVINNDKKEDLVSLLVMDIDDFKKINDKYGHSIGNICLVELANLANEQFADAYFVARIGGEEFAVLFTGVNSDEILRSAESFMNRVRMLKVRTEKGEISFTVSIGIAFCKKKTIVSEDYLFKQADKAMYLAKQDGKDRVEAIDCSTIITVES